MQKLTKGRKFYLVLAIFLVFSFFLHQAVWKNDLRVWKLDSSTTCSIPEIDPFSKSALLMIDIHGKIDGAPKCIGQEVKFTIDYKGSSLIRNETDPENWKALKCCYTVFRTEIAAAGAKIVNGPECFPIIDEITKLPYDHQHIDIKCRASATDKIIYRDQLTIFRLNPTIEEEVENLLQTRSRNDVEQPSVLVLGLDSVSHTGLLRHMPKTHSFLVQNLSATEYFGFNKIGSGTIQNVIAMTTGCRVKDLENPPWSIDPHCQLIWTHYAKSGYRTLHYEDAGFLEDHLYPAARNGTSETGTHYTLSEFTDGVIAIDEKEGDGTFEDGYGCFGNQYMYDVLVDETLEIARAFRHKPYFHFVWAGKMAHAVMRNTQFMDEPTVKLLAGLEEDNLLNNTILFILSDHGPWHGAYLNTDAGTIERLMPPFYAVFPDWFKSKYSTAINNFHLNARRLTTQYDFHETLLDLVDLAQISNSVVEFRMPKDDSLGQSLFLPVPLDRLCESANIPDEYCICWKRTNVLDPQRDPNVRKAVDFIMSQLESDLESFPQCAHMELGSILQARRLDSRVHEERSTWILQVIFTTLPASAELLATVSMGPAEIKLIGKPLRNNVYGGQSSCIAGWRNATYAKTICYCQ